MTVYFFSCVGWTFSVRWSYCIGLFSPEMQKLRTWLSVRWYCRLSLIVRHLSGLYDVKGKPSYTFRWFTFVSVRCFRRKMGRWLHVPRWVVVLPLGVPKVRLVTVLMIFRKFKDSYPHTPYTHIRVYTDIIKRIIMVLIYHFTILI